MEIKELKKKIKELKKIEKEQDEAIKNINKKIEIVDIDFNSIESKVNELLRSRERNIEQSESHTFSSIIDNVEDNPETLFALIPVICFMNAFSKQDEITGFMGKVFNFLISAFYFLSGLISVVSVVFLISSIVCLSYHKLAEVAYKSNAKAIDKEISKIKSPELQLSYNELLNLKNELKQKSSALYSSRRKVTQNRFELEKELNKNARSNAKNNKIKSIMNKSNKKSAVIEEEVEK